MSANLVRSNAKDVLAKKRRPSEQMALINMRWQQMRLLELNSECKLPPLPQKAANLAFDSLSEEETA